MAKKDKVYDYDIKAKSVSYSRMPRLKRHIKGIIIHNTGNEKDTAWGNCHFFSKDGDNTREAGAHFFVDQDGKIGRSIPMNRSAYAVGNPSGSYLPGTYNNVLNNSNTVSIELCDIMSREPSEAMLKSLDELVVYIKKYCPNVKYIARHYDVVKKDCPSRYVKDEKAWRLLQSRLEKLIK